MACHQGGLAWLRMLHVVWCVRDCTGCPFGCGVEITGIDLIVWAADQVYNRDLWWCCDATQQIRELHGMTRGVWLAAWWWLVVHCHQFRVACHQCGFSWLSMMHVVWSPQ